MKNEKSLKIKITAVAIGVAMAIAAITLLSVFIPKNKVASATTDKGSASAQSEQVLNQIDALEAEYQKAFDDNADLWEKYFAELQKLDTLPDDFDEKAFIGGLTVLTDDEKAALLKNVDLLDELDAKLDKLYGELFDQDEDMPYDDCLDGDCDFSEKDDDYFADYGCGDMLFIETDENFFGDDFGKLCDEAELANDQIQALKKEFDDVLDAHADLWDKVYASYDELDCDFDYANFDEATYIANLATLTQDEKDTLLKDLAKLDEISQKLVALCGANCGR